MPAGTFLFPSFWVSKTWLSQQRCQKTSLFPTEELHGFRTQCEFPIHSGGSSSDCIRKSDFRPSSSRSPNRTQDTILNPDPLLTTAELPFRATQNARTDVNSGYSSAFSLLSTIILCHLSVRGDCSHHPERSGQLSGRGRGALGLGLSASHLEHTVFLVGIPVVPRQLAGRRFARQALQQHTAALAISASWDAVRALVRLSTSWSILRHELPVYY